MAHTGTVDTLNAKLSFAGHTVFSDNTATKFGGAITTYYTNIKFFGTVRFTNNTANDAGGAIYIRQGDVQFDGNTKFSQNRAHSGGAIDTEYSSLSFASSTIFDNNSALENGGALNVLRTNVDLMGIVNFCFNSAENGGAIFLTAAATLYIESKNSNFSSSYNRASKYGGGIFYADNITPIQCNYINDYATFLQLPYCFLQFGMDFWTINIHSYYDSAGDDGSFLYGGILDKCKLKSLPSEHYHKPLNILMDIASITLHDEAVRGIGSYPYQLCVCDDNCTTTQTLKVYHGERFTVAVEALSQGSLETSTVIRAALSNSASLRLSQNSQLIPNSCYNLTYNLYSTKNFEQLVLFPDGPCRDTGLARVVINVELKNCPNAFIKDGEKCVCDKRLQVHGFNCTIDHQVF